MVVSDLYIALVIGVILSLIFADKTGIIPGGLVVPGYLALVLDQPIFLFVILLISLLTYLVVTYGLAKITILYGRRKFVAMLLVGIVLKLLFDYFYPIMPFEIFALSGIGIIVPGLLANAVQKQGMIFSYTSTLLLSGLTYLIMLGYYLI